MADTDVLIRSVLLVSGDGALARLVRLECHELALPLSLTDRWPVDPEGRVLLFDLDSPGVAAVLADTPAEEISGAAAICRNEDALPPELWGMFSAVLHRPFATTQLREVLIALCGGVRPYLREPAAAGTTGAVPLWRSADLPMEMISDTCVACGEHRVDLTASEGALLRCLLDRRGETVTKETLAERLGGSEGNKVEVYLCYLRRKLERPLGLRMITTVRGVGYRLE